MATEADFPEAISVTKGEGDRYLTSEQFDRNVEQCSPLELHKSKGELDQHHEIEKPFADSENVKVDCSTQVESKNNSFGISEGEHFLAPLSEISQADQSNQAAMEIAKTEDAKHQVERVEASKSETTVDQHVQAVISYQQDSTKENLQRLGNEAETSEVDVKGTEKADGNAESYRKEASGLLEATTFQEYEGSISTIDLTNNSLKKDIEMETNVDNTSSINPIFQEEFKEETSTKVTSNIEYDSQQTMHKYEQEEEIQKFPEVMPENAKTELASENAEVITCTDEERAIQNAKEYSEKEEANPVHIAEKEFEATRTEQVTGEHALLEIHTAEDHPQEFDEENSTYFQARVEAANLSANTVEKNSEEEVIQEKCSSLVEEQTTEKISREEEIHVTDLKKEEKETDARDEEPIEVADTTREIEFETIEQRTETNKDLYAPIPEEEAYAEESTKAFVQNTTFLSEVSEIKTKEIIQEDLPTVSNYGLVSGEVSHVSGSKEAETENKEHVEILTDATALETEDHAQAEESFNSKENMEKEIQTAEDEGKRDVKETSIVLEEEGLVTILTDQTALQTEDVELQAEENVDSKDISEKQISTVADEGENGLMEARAENNEKGTHTDITTEEKGIATTVTDESDTGLKEAEEANKEQVKISDISPEEKVLPTILTDETTLDIEDIDVQAEKNSNSIENVEKQIPVIADEGLKEAEEENKEQVKINDNSPEEILTDEAAVDNEEIELQAEENVNSKDNSEKQIPTVADEGEIYLAKAEAENNEQVTITDTTPEEKGLATISTDEKALDTEDIDVQAEESFHSEEKLEELIPTTEVRNTEISPEEKDLVTILANETSLDIQHPAVQAEETSNSKENLEKQISEAPDKGDTCVKEAGEENKEQVKNTDISPEEKGQETIIIDETTQNKEYIAVQAGENFISKEILEIPKAVDEDKTDLMEAEAESNEHVSTTEIGPEEKGLATILTDETAEDIEYNDAQAAEINSKEVLEKQIPTVVDEGETDLTEAEAECKEHVEYTGIAPEQKSVETILRDEPALNLEDVEQEQENFNSKENLENQIPTAVDEGEADLNRGEAENNEQVKNSDITVLRDETAMDIEDLQEKENQIPKEASEGEEKVGHGDIVFDHTPVNVYSTELVGDNTVEESFQVQSHEEAEQKLGVKDEKSEDHPERNDMIVEEVLEEPKITSRDFKEEQIIGGNVTIFTPESIEEDTVKNSQDNEKEENANDLSPEYIPEDGSEKFKDDKNDAVQSEGEILEHSQNVGVEESTTCETKNVKKSEEILSTLPVKYDQESSPAPKEALKEENIDEDTFSVQAAKDNDGDNGAVTVTETCAKAPSNDEEDSPQVLKYEPGEEITKLPDVLPEETIPESSNEIAEVITCTKEEIQESLHKESDPSTEEACNEAAELSTEGEKEKQTTQEVSSSLIGEETTEESSKEDENFVTSLQEEKNEEHEVCKEAIEAKSETIEDTTEPKPISEEESNKSLVEDNSFMSEASEKEIEKEIQSKCSCTVRNFDSEVVSDKTGLSEATTENKEQVETTHITPEEKDNAGTGVYNTELVGETIVEPNFQLQPLEEVLDEPKITDRDFNEEQITEGNVVNFATESIVEETVTNYQDDEKETEKLNEEGSSIENIKEGNADDISTECVPEDRGEKLEECIGEAVESKEEILQESQTDGSGEITTRDTTDADKTEEETTLQNDEPREVKVSNLALEKLDSDATEEETTGGSEVVPESDSKSIDVVTKDEVIADQTLYEGISKERSTLLAEEKELRASEHELETTSQDKNIEEEHAKEVEVPTANDTGDLLAPRSAEETCLPKEEPKELKVSELALEKIEAGESEEEIKETFETVSKFDSQSIGVVSESETTTCEIQNVEIYEEIVSTLPVKYDQGSSPAPTEALKEENTFSVQESKDNIDGDNGAVTVSETCAKVTSNDAEDSPQVFKYEPGEEITKLPDVLPEESIQESSREKAEVITCTKEEIQESLDKESDTSTGEACNDAAELSTEGEKEKQTTQEVSSSMIGKETTEESSKEKEQFVTSLQEETNEEHEVCKEAIEAKSETLEDTTEPKPISEEESNKSIVEDNSFLSEASEIQGEYCSTVRNFDSGVVSDKTGLTEATAQKKEQVETTHIVPEEKDNAGTDVYNDELVGETIVEPSFQVQPLEEEAEPKLEVEDETDKSDGAEKNNKILEEVLDEPKISDRDFNEEQITEGNVVNFATESIVEETVSDYQDDEKETEKLNEEGSSIETIKEGNANDISTECVPEDRDEKLEECIGEAVESKEENLQESQTNGLGENTTCDTSGAEMADSDAPEEETTGDSEVVPESDSKSIDVVTKDEIIADQTLDEEISKEPCTLLAEEKELRASEHEHGTTSQDKNIEEEHAKEVEVPTANDTGDSFAPRSVEETCLPKEEPIEKVSEFVLEMREAGENEEEIKETFETVSKFDSQSIGVVSEDEIITDQTQCEGNIDAPLQIPSYTLLTEEKYVKASEVVQETLDADTPEEEIKDGSAMVPKFDSESTDEVLKDVVISDQTLQEGLSTEQLQKPSSALLPEEKELRASEHEHDTTTVDKNLDEENPKEVEVPADEDKQDLYAATPAKEICLQADEPKDFELALQNLDAGELEEEIKGTFETVSKSDSQNIVVASGDDILADQTLCEGIADPPLSKDREFGATELALEKVDAEDNEEIKVPEIVTKFDSKSIEIVSNNEVIADQTFNEGITKEQIQSPSSTLLPEEKEREASEPEHETTAQDKNTEQECTKVEVSADEDTQALFAAGPVEEKSLQKEEPSEVNVSELAQEKLHAGDTEEANETFETVSKPDFPSTVAVSNEEITVDETLSKGVADIPLEIPSYTSLHKEKELKAFELDLEKQDADIPEEEIKEVSEVIPQSNSQSTYEVSKDEIIADQLQIPSSALVPDEKEFKASEHEYETTTDDKNIEDENLKEVEEPTDEATQDLFAARSTVESCLQKEKSSELKVPEVAPEKLDADETEEVKETFETVSKSDSESIYAVSKDELTDDQTLCDVITDMPLHIPSYTSLTKENELNPSELALEKLDANATEEVKGGSEVTPKSDLQSIDVVVKDEIIADQVLHEVITKDQLHIQSSILLPEEKELKESEHEHGTATQYKNLEKEYAEEIDVTADEDPRDLFVASSEEKTQLQKEEPRELKVSELAPEILNVDETEEVTENCERVSKTDPESTDAVSKDESVAERTLHQSDEQLQIASPTLLPKEKEEATVQKEEPEDCRVKELGLKELDAGETEEETKEAFETVPEFSSQSIVELATDEIVDQIPPSSLLTAEKRCENTTTIDNAEEKSMSVVETPNDESRKDTNIAEETSIPNEEPREINLFDLEFHSSQDKQRDSSHEVHEEEGCSLKEVPKVEPREDEEEEIFVDSNETKKNEASNEERNLEVATSDSRAEDWCETTIAANETAKIEVPNEEIKDEKEVVKDSQLIYVGEENIRASQQENESREEKYPEEKNETFNTAPSENHHEVTNPMEKDSGVEISQEGILGSEEACRNTRDIKQLEKESHATNIPSSNEAALNFLQDPTLEGTKPSNDTLVATETKEEKVSESGVETADSTSAQISERLMNESTKERMKVITHLTEEKEPTVCKELQADKEEEDEEEHENVKEAKTDEEKEDTEHKRTYQGYDEPVIVEASTDTEVKVKKSHNILSGMGSKVKHSISKVKKAIIGKSSNSKTQSEK